MAPQLFERCHDDLDEACLLLGLFDWDNQIEILIELFGVASSLKRLALLVERTCNYCTKQAPNWTDRSHQLHSLVGIIIHSRYGVIVRDKLVSDLPVEYVRKNANWLRCDVVEGDAGEVQVTPYEINRSFMLFE